MNWKNLKIGTKVGIGFGIVILLLAIVGGLSYTGTGTISTNYQKAITLAEIPPMLNQRLIDHLVWMNAIHDLFMKEDVTKLTIERCTYQP